VWPFSLDRQALDNVNGMAILGVVVARMESGGAWFGIEAEDQLRPAFSSQELAQELAMKNLRECRQDAARQRQGDGRSLLSNL